MFSTSYFVFSLRLYELKRERQTIQTESLAKKSHNVNSDRIVSIPGLA